MEWRNSDDIRRITKQTKTYATNFFDGTTTRIRRIERKEEKKNESEVWNFMKQKWYREWEASVNYLYKYVPIEKNTNTTYDNREILRNMKQVSEKEKPS